MSTIAAAIKGWFTGEEIVRNLVVAIAIGPIALFIVGAVSVANTKALIEAESAVDHQIEIRGSVYATIKGILGAMAWPFIDVWRRGTRRARSAATFSWVMSPISRHSPRRQRRRPKTPMRSYA